ncbi:serine/threonine-protein kinase [Streptomyces sp. RFCAC02]|uniref:serine/threonine-protein kinase n=1 Tax=Streptomyces sp. RFCAC02 TaxID=2499143 RepID=UPI00102055CB|nr:serine/threonine-protein kinase [Streptomyces sp. RFCAC02]
MAEGMLIHGRYHLLELIGRGGMGEVWRARDESLDRRVAVKCLKPMGGRQDETFLRTLRERFRREARVAAALQHRGVTVVHDFGEYEGVLYLVMELLEGNNLSELLAARGGAPMPVADIADIAEQVAAALAYTHGRGIVHRDLKPANIMRLTDGTVKICDFGIARLADSIGLTSKLTSAGMAMGTPHYMSPEQIAGTDVDHRSDIYSLGCVLYELATGSPPFDLGDPWSILIGHRDTEPEPPSVRRPDLPRELDDFVLALLAKDPDDRPDDVAEPARTLHALVHPATGAPFPRQHRATARMPAWTHGMRPGWRASGAWSTRLPPADRTGGLTGQWTGAVATLVQTPAGRRSPAPEYLAVLDSRHRAALGLGRLGRWSEAYDVHRLVAAERERTLGRDHPATLESQYFVSYALGRLGRWEEALAGHGYVADVRARVLGPDDPAVLETRYEAAVCLGRLGRPGEALRLYQHLAAAWARVTDPAHFQTLRARHGVGISLGRLGRWEEALAEARQVRALRAGTLGPEHPDTLVSHREVALAQSWLGRWEEALADHREVRRARERVLGHGHPDSVASRSEEADCLLRLGRDAEAAALHRSSVIPGDRRTPGR